MQAGGGDRKSNNYTDKLNVSSESGLTILSNPISSSESRSINARAAIAKASGKSEGTVSKVERVLAEEAKERQGERNDLKVVEDNNIQEKIPECSKYEPQARDKAASIIGNRVRQYCRTPINNRGLYARDG